MKAKKQYVYVLVGRWNYEGSKIIDIYKSEKKALRDAELVVGFDDVSVEKMELK